MAEEWRPIPDPEYAAFYEVSNLGRVRSSVRRKHSWVGRVLKPQRHPMGYVSVMLHGATRSSKLLVHRLVAAAFLRPGIPGEAVNHKDGDRTGNAAVNLEWVTYAENNLHSYRTLNRPPVVKRGSAHGMAKISETEVREIRALAGTMLVREIAARFCLGQTVVRDIIHRKLWKHVA